MRTAMVGLRASSGCTCAAQNPNAHFLATPFIQKDAKRPLCCGAVPEWSCSAELVMTLPSAWCLLRVVHEKLASESTHQILVGTARH